MQRTRMAVQQNRYRVSGVRRVRAARHGLDHQLGIAMVGRHQQHPARRVDRLDDAAQLLVHGRDRADRGGQVAGVTHHVRVGKIQHQ